MPSQKSRPYPFQQKHVLVEKMIMHKMPDNCKRKIVYLPGRSMLSIIALMTILISAALINTSFFSYGNPPAGLQVRARTISNNGADQWEDDRNTTPADGAFSPPPSKDINISSLFAAYYQSHEVAESLGNPVTVAFPSSQGWLQFFRSGALLLPTAQPEVTQDTRHLLATLVKSGTKDPATGVVRLPLLQALLTVGSLVPLGGEGSSISYVDLRKATAPRLMQSAPTATQTPSNQQSIFIKCGMRAGKDVGHFIPSSFWHYINRPDVSPDGWEKDFGSPLTEALSFTISENGSMHHMRVQAFARDALILDQDAPDQLGVQRLATGLDYLQTLGLPDAVIGTQKTIWSLGEAALLDAPATGQIIAHIGQNFALTLLGETNWIAGMLWYHVQWSSPHSTSSGWVSASTITFTSPGSVPEWASLDVLSPDLAQYLARSGSNAGAVVYDLTRQRYYTYNSNTQFITASSMKVPIMLTFLDMVEHQGRGISDDEMNLLTTMIENSDNDSASALYYNEIGGATGITNFLQKVGISDLKPDATEWGYSLITPQDMVNLLALLYEGKILNSQDRALAFNLMEHIETDQQIGVGDTAPGQATVAMKDGWVPGPDNLWAMNTSGIVTAGKETYIIAAYTQEQQTLDVGQAIVRQVCSDVASSLI